MPVLLRDNVKVFCILLLGAAGCFGDNATGTDQGNTTGEKRCEVGDAAYSHGEQFPSQDGCNQCSCDNGNVSCTERACQPTGKCFVGGCSGQLCTSIPDLVSTCEWAPAYACYQDYGICGAFGVGGACGWKQTSKLLDCLGDVKVCKLGHDTYKDGDRFLASDGCNQCECKDGDVVCTERLCVDDDQTLLEESLNRARKTWEAAQFTHYRFTYSRNCFCTRETRGPFVIEVNDGRVIHATYESSGVAVPVTKLEDLPTVNDVFVLIAEEIGRNPEVFSVEYDSMLGFPVKVQSDPVRGIADDEYTIELSGPVRL